MSWACRERRKAMAGVLRSETSEGCTWLGALSNLDLQLLRIRQELGSHAKAATGNLHAYERTSAAHP